MVPSRWILTLYPNSYGLKVHINRLRVTQLSCGSMLQRVNALNTIVYGIATLVAGSRQGRY